VVTDVAAQHQAVIDLIATVALDRVLLLGALRSL
jgi:hypothetical protein